MTTKPIAGRTGAEDVQNVLIDTSAWIEYFRGNEFTLCDQVESLLLEDRVVNFGPVEYELLRGARPGELAALDGQMKKIRYSEMTRADFRRAADIYKIMQAKGKTLHFVDLAIAAFCIERNLILLTLDNDFKDIPGLNRLLPNQI